MKRFILILILILIAVYATLSFFGAGDENVAERLFYRTMQTHQKIVQNPDVAPPQMVAEVENNMQKIIKDFPKAKTAKSAYSVLSEFFLMNKKYDQALLLLDEIINKYPEDTSLASKAQFFKGIVYERQGLWEEALQEYIILRDKYISTPLGLQVPFYIGYYYSQKGSLNKADQAYREAAIFYADLESKYRGKVLGYAAASFLLQTRLNLKEYERAGQVLEYIFENYPSLVTFSQHLVNVDTIFVEHLKNPEKAKQIYLRLKTKTDNPKLIETLEARIAALEE